MKFLLNGKLIEADAPADTTVLEFVRNRGLTGTKEGCASGDCGACTVMVIEDNDGSTSFHTVNSCILPLGQLAGRHLVTVEGLADGDVLHPAQQEMVDCHGSQCGFCTPGFVMSLATLVEQGASADRDTVLQGISGNLCRCTGYRPIVDAGIKALGSSHKSMLATDAPEYEASQYLLQPENEAALQAGIRENPGAKLVAGGTDLMLEVTQRYQPLPHMIDVTRVTELLAVSETESNLIVGAAVPYTRLETLFADRSSQAVELLHRLGSRQIRNSGTMGGNLANGSPIADMPPVLIAWDAMVELVDSSGAHRTVGVEDFYNGYRDTVLADDEYVARIHIPKSSLNDFHRFYKSSKRIEDDISSVMGAFRFEGSADRLTAARVAYGGMAATPLRLADVEALLVSGALNDALIEQAVDLADAGMSPLTDVRASADYRASMAGVMLMRALREWRGEKLALVTDLNLETADA